MGCVAAAMENDRLRPIKFLNGLAGRIVWPGARANVRAVANAPWAARLMKAYLGEAMRNVRSVLCALVLALPLCGVAQADIIKSWNSVHMPPPPALKTVTVTDPAHTALLLLDFDTSTCNKKE